MTDSKTAAPQLPDPLVPQEVDLRGYGFMPFYGNMLLNSDFHARTDDAAWRAGVMLWWAAWNQVPAASLPDDDAVLAHLAGLRGNRKWLKIRNEALHGFKKCSDGRLYHAFLAPLAIEAFSRRKAEREKKRRYRDSRSPGPDLLADTPVAGTGTDTGTEPTRERETGTATAKGEGYDRPFVLPDWIPAEAWNGYVDMRKANRWPLTNRAKWLTVDDLQQLREQGFDPDKILNQSVKRTWRGVFPIRDGGGSGRGGDLEEANRRAAEQFSKRSAH